MSCAEDLPKDENAEPISQQSYTQELNQAPSVDKQQQQLSLN